MVEVRRRQVAKVKGMGRTKTRPHVSDGTALVVVCLSGVSKVEHKKRGEASKK